MLKKNACLYLLIGCVSFQPAFAASDMEQGAKFYQAGEYAKARPLFEKAIKASPKNWQAHYYLANTHLALGDKVKAVQEYGACQKTCTDATIAKHCIDGISKASMSAPSARAAAPAPSAARVATSGTTSTPTQSPNAVMAEKHRENIMRAAREECTRIRKEAKEQMHHEKGNSQEVFQYHDGSVGTDISDEREEEIQHETDMRCRRVMEEAEARARGHR